MQDPSGLTSQSREPGVFPSRHLALLDEELELPLGQDGVDEIDPREIKDLDMRQPELLQEPLVLGFPVRVLVGPEGMGHPVERVDDGTSHVVHRVSLELVPGDVMGLQDGSEDGGVTERPVRAEVIDLGSHEPFLTFLGTLEHLFETLQVVLDRLVPSLRGDHGHTLVSHLKRVVMRVSRAGANLSFPEVPTVC